MRAPAIVRLVVAASNQLKQEEFTMSAINGDKSRYHRERKQKIARRKRTRELLERAPHQQKSV